MKKVLIAILLTLVPVMSYAAGEFDGIWETSVGEYAAIHQNGNSLVIISLSPGLLEWEAFQGDLEGNSAQLATVVSEVNSTIEVTFTSSAAASVSILS